MNEPAKELSWGRYFQFDQDVFEPFWGEDVSHFIQKIRSDKSREFLPSGFGRSYGDSCLNREGTLIRCTQLNRLLAFDPTSGIVRCESGLSFHELIRIFTPQGWFLPVTPGTKFISVGGAVANDIHGKNHHQEGTFGCHVRSLGLLRSDGTILTCSRLENPDLFCATIGGLGLTGIILWVEFGMKSVSSRMIDSEMIQMGGLNEFFHLTEESDGRFEYTVAWIDCLAKGSSLGRGLFIRGNHHPGKPKELTNQFIQQKIRKLSVPFEFPRSVLSPLNVRLFNSMFFYKNLTKSRIQIVDFDPFFYPLDAIQKWNRIYGRSGFFQYQFVIPMSQKAVIREILQTISRCSEASFLSVLKVFGDKVSPGLLSFPRPGVTLALDLRNNDKKSIRLFEELDRLVMAAGGRIYPAKDARMSASVFERSYPQWHDFLKFKDPQINSSFWKRVTEFKQ